MSARCLVSKADVDLLLFSFFFFFLKKSQCQDICPQWVLFVCFSLIQFYTNFLNSSDSSDGVMSIENTASRVPLDYIFICRVVDHVVRWGGEVICLFLLFFLFVFFKVQFNSSESAFAKGTLLRYSATEWQMHRQTEGGWRRWEVTTVAAECHFERVDLRCVWEGWGGGILKTNTGSAASSSSNQSSVTGNAGLGVCAWLKNCPSFKLSLPLGSVLNLHRAFCFV